MLLNTLRSAPIVQSSDEDVGVISTPVSSKHPAPFPMSRRSSESSSINLAGSSPVPNGVMDMELFDLEAIEDDEGHGLVPVPHDDIPDGTVHTQNDYDYADSFINDDSELSLHSDEEDCEDVPPPPAQKALAQHSYVESGEISSSDREEVPCAQYERPVGRRYARMSTGGRPPKRLQTDSSTLGPVTPSGTDVAHRSVDPVGDTMSPWRDRDQRKQSAEVVQVVPRDVIPTNNQLATPPRTEKKPYARMTTGGRPPKRLLPGETYTPRSESTSRTVVPTKRAAYDQDRDVCKTDDVLEISDSDDTDGEPRFRYRSDLSIFPFRHVKRERSVGDMVGPARRLRDGPAPDILDISSGEDAAMPSTPKKTTIPRYMPDTHETPSRSSSRLTSSRIPSRSAVRHAPAGGMTGSDAPTSVVTEPKTPSDGKKRKKSSKEYVLSPWEYGQMIQAIKLSRQEAAEREFRHASEVEPARRASPEPCVEASGGPDVRDKVQPGAARTLRQLEPSPTVDRKGKRKALRSPTPPRLRVPGFEDISPEELAEVLRALRESKAAAQAAATVTPGQGSSSRSTGSAVGPMAGASAAPVATGSPAAAAPGGPPPASSPPPQTYDAVRNDTSLARRCAGLPSTDATFDATLHDVLLAATYAGRPNLQKGGLIPWSNLQGRGHPLLTGFQSVLPKMSPTVAYDATVFSQVGDIRNPAWASPLDVVLLSVPGSGNRFHFHCDTTPPVPLLAVSCGWLEQSQLRIPASTGLRQRYLTLNIQSGEWERTVGFICTASGYPELYAQLAKDCLQFSSRAQAAHTSPGASSSSTVNAPASMFKQSTAAGNSRVASDTFSLPNNVTIPVYDARGHTSIDFNTVLPNLNSTFPEFGEEIPQGSFVMVGYTMTIYTANSGNRTLGCNIQWAIVFGCPTD